MTMWLVWLSALLIGAVWLVLIAVLCRQIAAGKWDPVYWPPEPASRAKPMGLDEFRTTLGSPETPATVVRVRFNGEGGFIED